MNDMHSFQVLCPCTLPSSSLFFLFSLKTVSFLKLALLDECRGDHGGKRHGDELVRYKFIFLT